MKKTIVVIFIIGILVLLSVAMLKIINLNEKNEVGENDNTQNENIENETSETETKVDEYIDTNPIKLGLYLSENGKRTLQTIYTNKWQYHKDINTFNIFYTQDEEIENSAIRICYGKYLENYNEDVVNNYKNGFNIHFTTTEGTVDQTILSPKDTEDFYDFLEIYLYDSYHRKAGEWYSHTTEEEFNDKTTLTSIKLTAGKRVKEITSDIEVTAFSYDEDDFDENGKYRGVSKYAITVKRDEN